MTLPDPVIGLDPAGTSVVGLSTWLWVDPSIWSVRSVTASAGSVSATAVASPVGVTWTTGDGAVVTCGGPGVAYDLAQPVGLAVDLLQPSVHELVTRTTVPGRRSR